MERKSIDVRCFFNPQERAEIFEKSRNRCCHCGCKLKQDNSSVEHVIPLDKGGSNDMKNLVGLCRTCNSEKSNLVIHPLGFYNYLKDEYLEELIEQQNEYYKEFNWLTKTNFIPEDIKYLSIPYFLPNGNIVKIKGNKKTQGISFIVRKCTIDDFDRVFDYIQTYNEKYYKEDDLLTRQELTERINGYFKSGCLYSVETKNQEIKGIIPIQIVYDLRDVLDESCVMHAELQGIDVAFFIENIICIYNTENIGNMMLKSLRYIFASLGKLKFTEHNMIDVIVHLNSTTPIGANISQCLYSDAVSVNGYEQVEDGTTVGSMYFYSLAYNNDIEYNYDRNFDYVEELRDSFTSDWHKRFSKGLVERFNGVYRKPTTSKSVKQVDSENDNADVITITCNISDLSPDSKCNKGQAISAFRRKQFRDNCLPPIRITQNLEVLQSSYDTYLILKENKVKRFKCIVTGNVSIDTDLINVSSDKYDADFVKKLKSGVVDIDLEVDTDIVETNVGDRCSICGRLFTETDEDLKKPVGAYIVPVWRGGSAKKENKVVCHKICSQLKGKLTLTDDVKSVICNELIDSKFFEN